MSRHIDTKYWIYVIISMWESNRFFIGASIGEKLEALEKSVRAQALLAAEELGANITAMDIEEGDRMLFYREHKYPDASICQSSGDYWDRVDSGVEQDIRRLSDEHDFEELYDEEMEQLLEEYTDELMEPVREWYRENSARFR